MTGVLARFEDVRAPEIRIGPMIIVDVPHLECEVDGCERPLAADCVWHEERAGALHLLQVCAQHVFLARGVWPAVFFPLGKAPSLAYIAQLVGQEVQRRRAAQRPQYVMHFGTSYNGTGTSTTWSWR